MVTVSLFDWFADRRKGQSVVKVTQEPEEGDGLWSKCPECSQVVYRKDLLANASVLMAHAGVTLSEMLLGLLLGTALGLMSALTLAFLRPIRPWLLPAGSGSSSGRPALAPAPAGWLGL